MQICYHRQKHSHKKHMPTRKFFRTFLVVALLGCIAAGTAYKFLTTHASGIAYSSTKAGNWDDPSIWSPTGVPGDGDTATIYAPITINGNVTIGTNAPDHTALDIRADMVVATGATLTLHGNVVQNAADGGDERGKYVTALAGSRIVFDATRASPASTTWTWTIGIGRLILQGTSDARIRVESLAGGGNGRFANGDVISTGSVDATYADFLRIGDALHDAIQTNFYYYHHESILRLSHCTIEQSGVVNAALSYGAGTFDISDSRFIRSVGLMPLNLVWNGALGGTQQIVNTDFDAPVSLQSANFTISGNTYRAPWVIDSVIQPETAGPYPPLTYAFNWPAWQSPASFLAADTTTGGNWTASYGADGYQVIGGTASLPSYATVTNIGTTDCTWAAAGTTTDERAPYTSPSATSRAAACWFGFGHSPNSYSPFSVDVNMTDGAAHKVSLYALDWDGGNRVERIDVIDAVSGQVLDSRSVSSFQNGAYLSWNIRGHVVLRFMGTINTAVVSGLFFDPPTGTPPSLNVAPALTRGSATTYTVTLPSTVPSTSVVFTPSDAGKGGTFNPTSLTLTNATPSATFTYTPTALGTGAISIANNQGLMDADPIPFTVTTPATTYLLTAPSPATSIAGEASDPFTVSLLPFTLVTGTMTVTPTDGGAGGTFSPASVSLSNASPSATFTYTAHAGGTVTISTANGGGLTDPSSATLTVAGSALTTYSFTGATRGEVAHDATFTVGLEEGTINGTVTVTPHASNGDGTFSPANVSLTNSRRSATFVYRPAKWGARTISVTNDRGLGNPSPASFLSMIQTGRSGMAPSGNATLDLGGFDLFANGPWLQEFKRDISNDPADPDSDRIMNTDTGLVNTTLNVNNFAGRYGMPINVVPGTQPLVPVELKSPWNSQCDAGPMPIPAYPSMEGWTDTGILPTEGNYGDGHMLILVRNEQTGGADTLWESSRMYVTSTGAWVSGYGDFKFDLTTGIPRPTNWTSGDAAGLPILPLLVRYDEVVRGDIGHIVRISLKNEYTSQSYVWPARNGASGGQGRGSGVPFGARFRLKQSWYDAHKDEFTGQARVILDGLRKYGMINADNTGNDPRPQLNPVPDDRWDWSNLQSLNGVPMSAFDIVDMHPVVEVTGPTVGIVGQPVTMTFSHWPPYDQNFSHPYLALIENGDAGKGLTPYVFLWPGHSPQFAPFVPTTAGTLSISILDTNYDRTTAPFTFTAINPENALTLRTSFRTLRAGQSDPPLATLTIKDGGATILTQDVTFTSGKGIASLPDDVKNNTHTLTLALTATGYTAVSAQVAGGVSGKVVTLPALTFGDLSGGNSQVTTPSVLQAIQCLASATNCGDILTPLLPLTFSDIVRLIRFMR